MRIYENIDLNHIHTKKTGKTIIEDKGLHVTITYNDTPMNFPTNDELDFLKSRAMGGIERYFTFPDGINVVVDIDPYQKGNATSLLVEYINVMKRMK